MRLYEDMIAGRISEQNFNTMLEKTQTEQTELKTKVSEGRKRLSDEVQLANDAKQWVEAIQEYANITELDAATLNRLIKEIVVHERIEDVYKRQALRSPKAPHRRAVIFRSHGLLQIIQGTPRFPCAGCRQLPFCGLAARKHLALQTVPSRQVSYNTLSFR